jgi:hypothetical protein
MQQMTFNNYLEQLADERAEAERLFILKVLTRKEAKNRRRPVRGWLVAESLGGSNGQPRS